VALVIETPFIFVSTCLLPLLLYCMYKANLTKYLAKKYRRTQRHYQEAISEILAGIQDQHGGEKGSLLGLWHVLHP
jgi:hypothetical protein